MERQFRSLSVFHFGFSWNSLMKSLCCGFKWHWDARFLSLPLSSRTWLIFLDFKLVQISETLLTMAEVIGGLKGLCRSSSTWGCVGFFVCVFFFNLPFHVNHFSRILIAWVWVYLFWAEKWIFRISLRWNKNLSLCYFLLCVLGCASAQHLFIFHG